MRMIINNLWRRGVRSLLTLLGIAVGVATVVALGTIAKGIGANYSGALGSGNDLLVTQANAYDVMFSTLDEALGDRIAAVPDVRNVDPGIFGWIAFDEMPYFLLYGYEVDSRAIAHYRLAEGKPITNNKQILLGRRAADTMKLAVGDQLRISGAPYKVAGIYETGQAMEESGGVVTLDDAREIVQKERTVSLFQVGLTPGANIDAVLERIDSLDKNLSASRSSDFDAGQQWSQYLSGFAWGVAAIAILIGGLGMMSAMVMSVLERTREIGTLRAVGWGRSRVLRLILGEALLLSAAGGLVGCIIGVWLAGLAGDIPGMGFMLKSEIEPAILVQGMATALTLGVVGGLYPAWTAANLLPVEALRYEGGSSGQSGGWLTRVGSQSFRNLWRRRNRTLLAVGGVAVGVAALVMLGGIVDGMIDQMNGLAGSTGTGSITVMQADTADLSLSTIDERIVNQIQAMPGVKAATPYVLGFISTLELPIFIFSGIDPNVRSIEHYRLVEGRYAQRPSEIVLGRIAADTYKLGVGDTLALTDSRYKIVGIVETGVSYEDSGGLMLLREAQRLLGRPRTVSFIFVDVQQPDEAATVVAAINRRYPDLRASLSSDFAQNTDDIQSTQAMTGAIQALAMLVGGIVVANTMIMSIHERTREIGTLRALGWKGTQVIGQVMQESLLLCFIGGVLGCVGGMAVVSLLVTIPAVGGFLQAQWSWQVFAQAMAVALVLGVIGGIYPAWRASQLAPAEALRYE